MNRELSVCYDVLKDVYISKRFSSIVLNDMLQSNNVNNALVTKIVYGVLENDLLLDYYLSGFYTKKPKNSVIVLLKMATYVNKFLNSIPPFALTNEVVTLSKKVSGGVSGFVNATLKNIIKTDIKYPDKNDLPHYLSVKYSYPLWLVKKLIKQFNSGSFVESLLSHKLTEQTHIRQNKLIDQHFDLEGFLNQNGIEYTTSKVSDGYYANYEKLLSYEDYNKNYIVMGETSMNLCQIINPKPSSAIYDACASPGGKSLYLSELNPTGKIVSGELHDIRVELINQMVKKYGATNITAIKQDATILNQEFVNAFDYVLCDVPCSGIGVVNKKPDILLNRKPQDIEILATLQLKILENCKNYVKNGGYLYYSTCTILQEENQQVVAKFLKNNPGFCIESIDNKNDIKHLDYNKTILYLPNVSDTEGFYIAKMVRKK